MAGPPESLDLSFFVIDFNLSTKRLSEYPLEETFGEEFKYIREEIDADILILRETHRNVVIDGALRGFDSIFC